MVDHAHSLQIVIPTITKDYLRMRHLVPRRIFKYLPVSELVFIGNSELCDVVNDDIEGKYGDLSIRAMNEEELVPRQPVVDYIRDRVARIDEDLLPKVRSGWYYQQFLKMEYCNICNSEYYMSWDMDTVPLRKIDLFDKEGHPLFGLKNEFNPGYFRTIDNLLGLKKNTEGSYISEHMVFGTKYMQKLIEAIGGSAIKGNDYKEKVIEAIEDDYIALGFSEFETYGTYMTANCPDVYRYCRFDSLRRGSWFVNERDIKEDDMSWIAKDYDAITFENAEQIDEMVQLFRNPKYRSNMSAKKFYETVLESGYFGEYSDGRINAGDWYAPV